ncbi:Eukaryotic translation initiation factor 3 subunit [Dirofilaria immitis]
MKALENNYEEFYVTGFRAYLHNNAVEQKAIHDCVHRLTNWKLFNWVISFQVMIIVFCILSALAVSIVEYLNPWPMLLMALILFIPIFPVLCSNQHEENFKMFGYMQLACGFVELFWSSHVILDMHYHSNDWRAYFTMCAVYWQFMSVILISVKCPLLEKIVNGQKNLTAIESNSVTEPSSCSVDSRVAKLRSILNFEKQRLDERKKRRKERLEKDECDKYAKESNDGLKQIEINNSRTAKDDAKVNVNKTSDLTTAKEQKDKHEESEKTKV